MKEGLAVSKWRRRQLYQAEVTHCNGDRTLQANHRRETDRSHQADRPTLKGTNSVPQVSQRYLVTQGCVPWVQ